MTFCPCPLVPVEVTVKVLPSAEITRVLTVVGLPFSVYEVSIVFGLVRLARPCHRPGCR